MKQSGKMPVLFIGHGSPMNAIEHNAYTKSWREIAARIPKPKAILCISAHWTTSATAVTVMERPRTIYDFYGFPKKLYATSYEAPGSRTLAEKIQSLVKSIPVALDTSWGLDHGTWSVLRQMYPKADIPTVQLSINIHLPFAEHATIGREIRKLRDEGVLIIGSGNLVHNLGMMAPEHHAYPWAEEFDTFVKDALVKNDTESLIHFTKHPFAAMAHPTPEHFIPLLYVLGAKEKNEKPVFSNEGIAFGSVSMRAVVFGAI